MRQHTAIQYLIWLCMVCGIASGIRAAAARRATGAVALLNSEWTHKLYQKNKADYPLLFVLWTEAIRRQGGDFQTVTDADLERGNLQKYSALVLPGAVALSDLELAAVTRFVQSGGGLLLGGASGTLSPDGRWRGWDWVKELTGLDEIRALRKKNYKSLYVTLIGGSPLTLNLPAGLRIENVFYNDNYAGIARTQDAYWSDSDGPLYVSHHNTYYTAIKTGHYGKGRVAWFGFNLESMNEEPEDQQSLLTLFGNTLRWLRQEPVAQVALWPNDARMAVSLTFDCENDFANLTNLLNRRDVPSFHFTFFMLSSLAEQFPEVVRRATAIGEVAIHGDDHSIFKGQSHETQLQRLTRAQEKLQALSGGPVISFRPPEQRFDENTLLALRKLGIRNFFSDYNLSSTPYFQTAEQPGSGSSAAKDSQAYTLVTFPRPDYDDYDLFVRFQLSNDAAIAYITQDCNRVDKERGLYVLNMHTTAPWGGLTRHRIRVLSTLIKLLDQRKDVWLPTIREAGGWWQMRSRIELKVTEAQNESLSLEILNTNEKLLAGVCVELYLPDAYAQSKIRMEGIGSGPAWPMDQSEGKLIVHIPALQPHEMKRCRLVFGKPWDKSTE